MGLLDRFRGDAGYVRLAILVILVGAALRFILAALSHPAGDSCLHLSAARFIAANGQIPFLEPFGDGREVFWAPPLFHIIAAAVYDVFSLFSTAAAELVIKLISPLFGSLTLPFIFLIARKLFHSNRLAFFATFFVAFLPLHVYASTLSFVDSFVTFFTTAAMYFALEKRIVIGAVLLGLSLSAKQNALFILPVFFLALYLAYHSSFTEFMKKSLIAGAITLVVGLPWFARNFLLLGNPFWPFLYKVLGGTIAPKAVESMFSASYLLTPGAHLLQFYLELFGVPSGSVASFSFVQLPFMQLLISGWFAAALLFFAPIVSGLFVKNRHRLLLYSWLLSFFVMLLLYIMNLGMVFARLALPAIPVLAVLWALGLDRLLAKLGSRRIGSIKFAAIILAALVGCAAIFASAEVVKVKVAANSWDAYAEDFAWVRENTPTDALIGYRGQCLSYNVNRLSNYKLEEVDYVWVNQDFRLEPISIVQPHYLSQVQNDFALVYQNAATGTSVYKRRS